jgi:hypothetical protein
LEPFFIPEEWKENYRYAFEQARQDRPRYLQWIKTEIETAIDLINRFDKVAMLGGLAVKLIKSTPNLYTHFIAGYEGEDAAEVEEEKLQPDDDIEVLLEYAMNLTTATPNGQKVVLPTQNDIDNLYDQLSKIKININFWEMSAEAPAGAGESDQFLKTMVVQDSINVRGQGYFPHVNEVFAEVFVPHNGFLSQYYGFDAKDLLATVLKLDKLVSSKIGSPYGFMHAMERFNAWGKAHGEDKPGGFFPIPFHLREFLKDNPDMAGSGDASAPTSFSLGSIGSYNQLFWVRPENEIERKVFAQLNLAFGGNGIFFASQYKGFPQGDTALKRRPLISEDGKSYHFSFNFAYRNLFFIAESLIQEASAVYYDNYYLNNAHPTTKDNCIERKTLGIFQQLLPGASFYHNLLYNTTSEGEEKKNELDLLGVSTDGIYIVEVKAGEYNTKIRRGALKGLKDKLKETVGKGTQQCHRAWQYIQDTASPTLTYAQGGTRHTLTIDKAKLPAIYRITVTFEQLSIVGLHLRELIEAGIVDQTFADTWIVSIYDLMVFRDLIASEAEFTDYIHNRMSLYQREDIVFLDEIDVLGFYFDGGFPLPAPKADQVITMTGYDKEITEYYSQKDMGLPVQKPVRRQK